MPELPEVQTVVNGLNHYVKGLEIKSVKVLRASVVQQDQAFFENAVSNKIIRNVQRQGKYILFDLGDDNWIMAHLRMTGKFIVRKSPVIEHAHDRVMFYLEKDHVLIFNDVRCFGTIEYLIKIESNSKLQQLGWDPWDPKMTGKALYNKLKKRTVSIKTLLLDQGIIAGLGNIYASEILFKAGISPMSRGDQLNLQQIKKLIGSTRFILKEALKYNGTSISDYRRVDDKQGTFQNFLNVYGKENQLCPQCSQPILKMKQNQRSTYFCNQCQP